MQWMPPGTSALQRCRRAWNTAACCVLDTIDQDFLDKVKEKGDYLRTQIETMDIPCLGKTRGMGLMIGIEVKGDRTNRELAAALAEHGLLCLTAGPGLRLLPPLVISQEEMDKGLLRKMPVIDLVSTLVSLVVFPLLIRKPLAAAFLDNDMGRVEEYMDRRSDLIVEVITQLMVPDAR